MHEDISILRTIYAFRVLLRLVIISSLDSCFGKVKVVRKKKQVLGIISHKIVRHFYDHTTKTS